VSTITRKVATSATGKASNHTKLHFNNDMDTNPGLEFRPHKVGVIHGIVYGRLRATTCAGASGASHWISSVARLHDSAGTGSAPQI
jgi:hypothetical protein